MSEYGEVRDCQLTSEFSHLPPVAVGGKERLSHRSSLGFNGSHLSSKARGAGLTNTPTMMKVEKKTLIFPFEDL